MIPNVEINSKCQSYESLNFLCSLQRVSWMRNKPKNVWKVFFFLRTLYLPNESDVISFNPPTDRFKQTPAKNQQNANFTEKSEDHSWSAYSPRKKVFRRECKKETNDKWNYYITDKIKATLNRKMNKSQGKRRMQPKRTLFNCKRQSLCVRARSFSSAFCSKNTSETIKKDEDIFFSVSWWKVLKAALSLLVRILYETRNKEGRKLGANERVQTQQ